MSTRIDINVARELLLRLSRAQANANRQGLLEKERRERLAKQGTAEAERQRAQTTAQQGPGFSIPRLPSRFLLREEPAATPRTTLEPGVGHAYIESYSGPYEGLGADYERWYRVYNGNRTSYVDLDFKGGIPAPPVGTEGVPDFPARYTGYGVSSTDAYSTPDVQYTTTEYFRNGYVENGSGGFTGILLGTYLYTRQYSQREWQEQEQIVLLPVSDTACIVAVYFYVNWSVQGPQRYTEELWYDTFPPVSSGGGTVIPRRTIRNAFGTTSHGVTREVRCALVTSTTVREVPAPDGLKDKLDAILGGSFVPTPVTFVNQTDWTSAFDGNPTLEAAANSGATREEVTAYVVQSPRVPPNEFESDTARSFGIKQMIAGVYDGSTLTASPSIYPYLDLMRDTDIDIYDPGFAEQFSPAAWQAYLVEQVGFPPLVLVPTSVTTPYTYSRYTGPLPGADPDTIAPDAEGLTAQPRLSFTPEILAPTAPPPIGADPDSLTPQIVKFTGWRTSRGGANYARQQALALGFTPEDLTP